jgi:hypothetical protein
MHSWGQQLSAIDLPVHPDKIKVDLMRRVLLRSELR